MSQNSLTSCAVRSHDAVVAFVIDAAIVVIQLSRVVPYLLKCDHVRKFVPDLAKILAHNLRWAAHQLCNVLLPHMPMKHEIPQVVRADL
jgi:hypothetical protein